MNLVNTEIYVVQAACVYYPMSMERSVLYYYASSSLG
jgi:hypothetical protein